MALTGHSAAGGAHDLATDSLVVHVLAASIWVGGLVAVLATAAGRGPDRTAALSTAVPRFSRLALVCWLALAVTGVLNALVRIPPDLLLGSGYGALVLAKAGALLALARPALSTAEPRSRRRPAASRGRCCGWVVSRCCSCWPRSGWRWPSAAAPHRTPEPCPPARRRSSGTTWPGPPTVARLAFDWRFNLIFGTAAIVLAVVYLVGMRRLRRRGDSWPVGRTVSWLGGCFGLLVATSSGLGRYGPAMFSAHMAQHMILGMVVPILLVLGAPVTLALRALPPAGRSRPPGPREWLVAAVHAAPARWLTNPLVTFPLFVGGYYGLYFSGLFPAALPEHWAHQLMNLHFLLVGALFFWPLIGVDPSPRRLPPAVRLGIVFASVPFHAFFGRGLDERQLRARRELLPEPGAALGARSTARPAARRWTGLGVRGAPAADRGGGTAHRSGPDRTSGRPGAMIVEPMLTATPS